MRVAQKHDAISQAIVIPRENRNSWESEDLGKIVVAKPNTEVELKCRMNDSPQENWPQKFRRDGIIKSGNGRADVAAAVRGLFTRARSSSASTGKHARTRAQHGPKQNQIEPLLY